MMLRVVFNIHLYCSHTTCHASNQAHFRLRMEQFGARYQFHSLQTVGLSFEPFYFCICMSVLYLMFFFLPKEYTMQFGMI
jgi:hypothetical protein